MSISATHGMSAGLALVAMLLVGCSNETPPSPAGPSSSTFVSTTTPTESAAPAVPMDVSTSTSSTTVPTSSTTVPTSSTTVPTSSTTVPTSSTTVVVPAESVAVASDRAALVALYNAMDGPNWSARTNWLSDEPLEEWHGVTTDGSTGRVISLRLSGNGLQGELPSELGHLRALEILDLSMSHITDMSALSQPTNLRVLLLSGTGISDVSPLLSLTQLHEVGLEGNSLSSTSINTHIPILFARGVEVTGNGHTHEDGPQIYGDNLFVLPVQSVRSIGIDPIRTFYEHFHDEFDFLMFVSPVLHQPPDLPFASYLGVRNNVRGIGRGLFDDGSLYGSEANLQGVLTFNNFWAAQDRTLLHELMHRWGASILISELSDGAHWLAPSNINGFLGGFASVPFDEIVELGESLYSFGHEEDWYLRRGVWAKDVFPPLELYLSGFIPLEEVPDIWIAADAEWVEWPLTFTASNIHRYTIDDVIAAHGKRNPEASRSQHDFRAAAILLMDEKNPATLDKLGWLSMVMTEFSHPGIEEIRRDPSALEEVVNFYEATGGRGTITMGGLSQLLRNTEDK